MKRLNDAVTDSEVTGLEACMILNKRRQELPRIARKMESDNALKSRDYPIFDYDVLSENKSKKQLVLFTEINIQEI